jgi:hypothetical protein
MSLEALLSRLNRVKGRAGSYVACCPAHEDSSPSLAVKEVEGKIILHCFAGCSVNDIVGAVGMDMTDLFPPKAPDYRPQQPVKFFASDLLKVLHLEARIVMVAAYDVRKGRALSAVDMARLELAWSRINDAVENANA